MNRLIRLLAVLLLFISTAGFAKPPKLLILGDSLSAGYGLNDPQKGWVALLSEDLQGQWTVINASVSGETSAGARNRLPALLAQHQPQAILVEIGGNDGLRGYSLSELQNNLEAIIKLTEQANAQIWLMEIQIPPNYGRRYTEKFNAIYHQLAESNNVQLVPFFLSEVALDKNLMQADGIHPNEKAQPIMRDLVRSAMAQDSSPVIAPTAGHEIH